jgi:hypothetical protein
MTALADIPGYDEPAPARTPEQRLRDVLEALAHWLTDRDDYDIPVQVIRAACPDWVPETRQDDYFGDLLRVVCQLIDRTDLPFDGQVAIDYMTGAR